jgi:hypothetical protein
MKLHYTNLSYCLVAMLGLILTACTAENKVKDRSYMKINERSTGLSFRKLKNQDQLINNTAGSRGLVDNYLISLATNGIKTVIDNRKKRYTAAYSMALTDLHFYNDLSTNGTFDPEGIIFKGFTLVRVVNAKYDDEPDTAFIAHFVLDTTNSYEIANSSMFRLKLDSLDFRFPKARFRNNHKKINIDFEITFTCSYVNETGNFFSNVTLGKFMLNVRDAPMDKNDTSYIPFYNRLRNKPLTGASFIVPRSYGYYISEGNELKPSYSWGNYSISATVTESSKEAFVDKIISDNSDLIVNSSKTQLTKASTAVSKKLK